ncbi:MAG: nucleoid-structuring protein H-NS [Mailhella sp.]|nr:nucleoid-structuring protein H-NS [Mailhella sp.]
MRFRYLVLTAAAIAMLAGCQKKSEPELLIAPGLTVAVAPYTQPTQTADLLSGFIPEGQRKISAEALASLDEAFRGKLDHKGRRYVMLRLSDIQGDMARDSRGRRSALVTWAERARRAGADMIVVPQAIEIRELVGSKAGAVTSASVNEDFYLIDAREPAALLRRSHFAEEQKALSEDLTKIGKFFKRGGGWLTAGELAAEGMDKAVEAFGL